MKKWFSFIFSFVLVMNFLAHVNAQNFVVSPHQSLLQLERQTAPSNDQSIVLLRGVVRDTNKTPLPNVPVTIRSNRGGVDTVVSQPKTDQQGRFVSRIRSNQPGQSIMTVWANGTELFEKPIITFFTLSDTKNVGSSGFGQFLQASLFGRSDRSQTEYFVLEDLTSPLAINDKVSIKVTAKDANGNVDPNYRGTIRFVTPTDPNAQPPADYTFTEADQGVHNFYLAISFGTIGAHQLVVKDTSDIRVSGEINVDVIPRPADGGVDIEVDGGANLQAGNIDINVPSNGSTFSSSRITLSGTAPGIQTLQLFDGSTLVSNNIPVNPDGAFTYQTPQLADGLHQFQFFSNDETGQEFKSDKIRVTIDQTPPTVLKVDLIPGNEAEPGEEVTVMVGSSEDLSLVEGIFQGQPMLFERIDERTFRAFITAPNNGGAYPISVSAADLLGNTKNEPNAEVLYVKLPSVFVPPVVEAAPIVEEPIEYESLNRNDRPSVTPPPVIETSLPPTSIVNLSAVPGDNRVTLFWSPATDDNGIKQYKINYGLSQNAVAPDSIPGESLINNIPSQPNGQPELNNINLTPDARTQWYVDGLIPCEKVKFSVTPIDDDGQEGDTSNIVESSAKCTRPNTVVPPKSGGSNLFSILIGMIFGGICVLFARFRAS